MEFNAAVNRPIDISKELETITLKTLLEDGHDGNDGTHLKKKHVTYSIDSKNFKDQDKNESTNQFIVFQKSMRIIMIYGQCIGLLPFQGVTATDINDIRFSMVSWIFLFSGINLLGHIVVGCFNLIRLIEIDLTVNGLGFVVFYVTAATTTYMSMRIARKWPSLMRELHNSDLNEYFDNNLQRKCNLAFVIFVVFVLGERLFLFLFRFVTVNDCNTDTSLFFYEYNMISLPWLKNVNIPLNLPIGILLQCQVMFTALAWSYSDIFLICISMYLAGILEKINKKVILNHKKTDLTVEFWGSLRDDYNRATRLVHSFDDVISCVMFTSFANNLFFICFQIFTILAKGVTGIMIFKKDCPNFPSGPFHGYEYAVCLTYSVVFLFGRSLAVSLFAAKVHTASTASSTALYEVPSFMYCEEIQRFIDQIHGDKVALTGLQFFYVTRELALSMAATIVTYELVLLQFSTS